MDDGDLKGSQKDSLQIGVDDMGGVSVLSRLEVISGPSGRRRWPLDVKARIVAESYSSGEAVSAVARRNGLRANQLFLWRRQAREGRLVPAADMPGGFDRDDPGFVPAVLVGSRHTGVASGGPATGLLEIAAFGVVVRLREDAPGARIGEIAAALRVTE